MRRLLFVVALLTGLCCGELRAQSTNASVTGYITDPTKAVIVGAKVIVINVATNIRYEATTNSAGSYDVTNLPPGPYRIEVEKPGFKTVVKSDVILHVQDTAAINFEMALGSASEIITVTAGGLVINTTDAAVSTVIDRQFAENLPMNGRSFQTLIELTPGVVLTPSNGSDNGQFSVNGQRATSNYWMVDGVSANIGIGVPGNPTGSPGNGLGGSLGSFSASGGTNSLVSVDALQEFRIQTSTYAPEFGRTPGGQISIVTRSGTNQFHGTAFDYFRNDLLDANNWFANFTGQPKPKERQNDFGGTFSGPILKDRTFFFFSYEGLRLRLPQVALTTVPCDSTCTVFGNARTMAASAMQPYFNAYPVPNGPEVFTPCTPNVSGCPASGKQPTGAAQFNASFSNPSTLNAYSLRVDHRLSSKWTLFGRYNYSPSDIAQRAAGSYAASVVKTTSITTQTGTIGATWIASPSATNDLRFNYSRTEASSRYGLDNFEGAVPLASLPFPSPFTSQDGLFLSRIIRLRQGSIFVGALARNLQRQINLVDGLSVQKGSHGFKFGVDFRRLSPQANPLAYQEAVLFLSVPPAESGSSLLVAQGSNLSATFLFRNLGLYAQDTWRAIRRLTLTYGLRWDVDFVPQSLNGPSLPAVTGFNLSDLSSLALTPAGTPPYKTTYGNFAPRIGVAYQLRQSQDWQTVLRGGFGVFYDLASSEAGNVVNAGVYPFGAQTLSFGGNFPRDPATLAPPKVTPASLKPPTLSVLYAIDPNLKQPYTLEWNVALEQALGTQQTISASYIGADGRRLLQTAYVVSPNPSLGYAQLVTNAGTSYYSALQLQFQRRLLRGLQALASYTWSHSIDTGSAGSNAVGSNGLVSGGSQYSNRGPSDFDIRNAFSAALTYDVPALKTNAFSTAILRGWSIDNIIQARSAAPVDVSDATNFMNYGAFAGVNRPDLVPGQPLYLYAAQYPGGKTFNPAAFVSPTSGQHGNLGRNALRGFGAAQWDFAVHRDFRIHESLRLQFRAEMFNVLNHPNFGPPNGQFGTGGFGLSSQTLGQYLNGGNSGSSNVGGGAFNPLYQIGGPRSIQFALKVVF